MSKFSPRIAIVGGGPSGLTIGVLLHQRGIPFTIYELRSKPTEEELMQPAGMLDLHEESGLAALKECDLLDEFKAHTGVCAEYQIVANKEGTIVYTDAEGTPEMRPEISRNSLTKILLDRLPVGAIRWEHKLVATKRKTSMTGVTEIELDFGPLDGKHTFDFVVGADGAWSRVRGLLTDTKPNYAGVQCITVTARGITTKYPEIARYVGPGSFACLGQKHGVMSQRALQDSARIYVFITTKDEKFASTNGLADLTPSEATEILLNNDSLLGQFGQPIKSLVQMACDEQTKDQPTTNLDIKPLYTLPIGHKWPHRAGVTVIGDASHLMCPWAGEGVNLAMWDSLDVAHAIIQAYQEFESASASTTATSSVRSFGSILDPLIQKFEIEMTTRAETKAEETQQNGRMMFGSEDGAAAMTQWFKEMMELHGQQNRNEVADEEETRLKIVAE